MSYESQIYNKAIADGMPRPLALLIVAQAKHETNNFQSSIFQDCKNAFCYKVFGNARPCPGHTDYEAYNNVIDSTHEITAWIKRRLNEGNFPPLLTVTDPVQYATILKNNGYYGDSLNNYAAGLENWYKDNINGSMSAGILIAAIVAILIIRRA